MGVSGSTIFQARATATAANVNGGGFRSGASGNDYSKQDAAQYALSGLTSAGVGNILLAALAAVDMIGNLAKVTGGTGVTLTNPWFEITAALAGVSLTFSTNKDGTSIASGVASGVSLNIGGAFSLGHTSDNNAISQMQTGNTLVVSPGSYNLTGAGSSIVYLPTPVLWWKPTLIFY